MRIFWLSVLVVYNIAWCWNVVHACEPAHAVVKEDVKEEKAARSFGHKPFPKNYNNTPDFDYSKTGNNNRAYSHGYRGGYNRDWSLYLHVWCTTYDRGNTSGMKCYSN